MDAKSKSARSHKNLILIIVVLILIILISFGLWFKSTTGKIFVSGINISGAKDSIQQNLDSKTPFNILLLGYGGGNHDGAYLTDSIIVVRVDPKEQKIYLVSIPRDIWIKIPTDGQTSSYWKINTAYTIGMDDKDYPHKQAQFKGSDNGGHMAEYIVSQVIGQPIQYFIGMDFAGFTHTIDTLNGVDINVNPAFDDYEYPIEGKEDDLCGHSQSDLPMLEAEATQSAIETVFPCRYEHLHFNAGLQHMDGATALKYVRSRHSLQDGTDFGRAKRQRNLIEAVKKKVFSIGFIPRVFPFMSSLGDDLRTDLTLDDVKTLLQNANTLNKYQITTLALTDQNYLVDTFSSDGQAILEPKDGIDDWTNVHNWITDSTSSSVQPVEAVVQVENGTNIAGLAALATNRLKNDGLQVLSPEDAGNKNSAVTTITVFDKNIDSKNIEVLKKEFNVTTVTQDSNQNQNKYNVLVTVGSNYNNLQGKKFLNE